MSTRWRNFDVSVFFQGVDHVSRVISGSNLYGQSGSILYYGQIFEDVAENRWSEFSRDPNSKYPRMSMTSNANNSCSSTFWLRDMSFAFEKCGDRLFFAKKFSKKNGTFYTSFLCARC
ncbi:MAG: hypothetical protein ACLR6J_01540 [Parabacteroides merdae]